MNITLFTEAQEAYLAGDYEKALAGFTVCTHDLDDLEPADIAKFYHLIGNCYIKSGNPSQAAEYYNRALEVGPAHRAPALLVNLGTALLSSKEYARAAEAFTKALTYSDYATPYKAYSGLGAAQMELGNITEAGAAYREAAMDAENPNPGKALVNLGACFMELDRPADAVVSYEAALELGLAPATVNKVHSNLGQAYLAQGHFTAAVDAFEAATRDGSYALSPLATHDYRMACSFKERFGEAFVTLENMNSQRDAAAEEEPEQPVEEEATQVEAQEDPGATLAMDTAALAAGLEAMEQAADADEADALEAAEEEAFAQPEVEEDPTAAQTIAFPVVDANGEQGSSGLTGPLSAIGDGDEETLMPSPDNTNFFTISEDQINKDAKEEMRRKHRGRGIFLKILLAIVILLVLAAGAAAFAYTQGYGYPTQESVTRQFITAVQNSQSTDVYWADSVSQDSRDSQMASLEGVSSSEITAVERAISQSTVYVSATLDEGGTVYYRVVLGRDGITWVVQYVELYFPSAQQ